MKLELQNIRWKNFNSYGEMWTSIDLNRSPLTVMSGLNGHGKSTITDAISFVLFGKPIRLNKKGNIVNRTNKKNLVVEINFVIDGVDYQIRRGLKPELFEVYEKGILLNQDASNRDYQKTLEDRILRMNFITFSQSVVVSKTLYTPFMQLTKPKRREYVEDILRLKVFSNMSKKHAEELKRAKADNSDAEYEYDKSVVEYNGLSNTIEALTRVAENSTKEKELDIQSRIDDIDSKLQEYANEYKAIKAKLPEIDESFDVKFDTNNRALIKLKSKLEDVEEAIEKLNTSENLCKACGHELSTDHVEKHLNELNTKRNELIAGIAKVDNLLVELKPKVDENKVLKQQYQELSSEMMGIQRLMQGINSDKKSLQSELANVTVDTSELDTAKERLVLVTERKELLFTKHKEAVDHLRRCTLIATMLKDNGIKASIVEKSIPMINKLINQNLSKFGFFVQFELDSEFNEKILLRGFQEASYYDFSEGEKLRIDMAILLAWRDIAMLRNAMSCNVLFLDEITDASLDDEGIAIFTNMLSCLKDNNVFVITHKPEKLDNIARSSITIVKKDGYSQIA